RIAILRALKLGDMLCAVPAFRSLRAGLPHARITLIGLPWADAIVERFSAFVDHFMAFPGYPGLPEQPVQPEAVVRFLARTQSERFDLVVQMQGSGSFVNPLVALVGARRCAGFFTPGDYCPDNETFMPYPESGLEIRRLLQLMGFLGFPRAPEDLEFPLRAGDFDSLREATKDVLLGPGEYVCLHPGASAPERRWPVSRFAEVA